MQLVRNKGVLDLSKLPTEEELRTIYGMDTLMLLGYQKKIAILENL